MQNDRTATFIYTLGIIIIITRSSEATGASSGSRRGCVFTGTISWRISHNGHFHSSLTGS